ncbi:MAG: hypothetical protein GX774_08430, partial [Armatimonadetes bacterium]|nr:hypothetical protein [Armatimonadota bacterium]
ISGEALAPWELAGPAHRYPPAETERARQAAIAVHGDLLERQHQYNLASQKLHKELRRAWSRHEWTQRLQAGLVGMPQGLDYRWLYLVTRCLMLSAETDALIKGSWRATRHGNGAMGQASSVCLLAAQDPAADGRLSAPLLTTTAGEMERAGKEILQSAEAIAKAVPDIAEADRLVAGVLADLNAPHFLRWPSTWGHLAALEALLQQAGHCLARARRHVASATRDAARARARAEHAAIDLAAATARPEEAAIFRQLLRARLGATEEEMTALLERGCSLGDAAIILLYARNTNKPTAPLMAAHQGNATWVETAEKLGLPADTQAIVLRLLHNTIVEERIRG